MGVLLVAALRFRKESAMKLVFLANFGAAFDRQRRKAAKRICANHHVKVDVDDGVLVLDERSLLDDLFNNISPLLVKTTSPEQFASWDELQRELSTCDIPTPAAKCPVCGCTEDPDPNLYPGQDWPRCPGCHSC